MAIGLFCWLCGGIAGYCVGAAVTRWRIRERLDEGQDYQPWVDRDGLWHAPCKRADIPPGQDKPRPQDVLDEPRAIKGGR